MTHGLSPFIFGLIVAVVQAFSEEVFARGVVQRITMANWGFWRGVIISALLFSLTHIFVRDFNLLSFLVFFMFGVFVGLYMVVVDGGNLWGVIGIHTAWNYTQQYILRFDFPQSGVTNILGMVVILSLMTGYIMVHYKLRIVGLSKSFSS